MSEPMEFSYAALAPALIAWHPGDGPPCLVIRDTEGKVRVKIYHNRLELDPAFPLDETAERFVECVRCTFARRQS